MFLEEFLTAKKSDDTTDESDAVASTLSDSDTVQWAHLDIAGVMNDAATHGHNIKGMSGRPVRTLVEFARSLSGGASEK